VFCCALLVDIDNREQLVRYWNGGMPTACLLRTGQGIVARLVSSHLPFGIVRDDRFRNAVDTIRFEAGDRLFCYSDGVMEAADAEGRLFGEQRIEALLATASDQDSLVGKVRAALHAFAPERQENDDATMVAVTIDTEVLGMREAAPDPGGPQRGPKDFDFSLNLHAQALRESDPLPLLLYSLMEVPGLHNHRGQVFTILAELFSNALEHGILRLDSKLKQSPQGFGEYYRLRHERLLALEQGQITLAFSHREQADGGCLQIRVSDTGSGFDHHSLTASLPAMDQGYCGRGLGLLRQLCRQLRYEGCGNIVHAEFHWSKNE
jgi:anti-sigma regulatory factor (Ser/Thr protein kinase)